MFWILAVGSWLVGAILVVVLWRWLYRGGLSRWTQVALTVLLILALIFVTGATLVAILVVLWGIQGGPGWI